VQPNDVDCCCWLVAMPYRFHVLKAARDVPYSEGLEKRSATPLLFATRGKNGGEDGGKNGGEDGGKEGGKNGGGDGGGDGGNDGGWDG